MPDRVYPPPRASSDVVTKNYWIITAIIVSVIVYGSLFPFEFARPSPDIGAARELLRTWAEPPPSLGNLLANLLLYVPLGFFEVLALGRFGTITCFAFTLASGLLLCAGVELVQYYDVGRVTNASDVYLNTAGAAIGALGGLLAHRYFEWLLRRKIPINPAPAMLLVGWLGYRLFPYVPTIDLHKYWDSLKPIFLNPTLSSYELVRSVVVWLAIAALVENVVGSRRSRFLYPVAAGFVLIAEVFIVTKFITPAELVGAAISFALWLALLEVGPRPRNWVLALLFAAIVVAQRLAPFDFRSPAAQFGLIPFVSLMNSSLSVNIQSFFEKFFLYGTLIWLIYQASGDWVRATGSTTALLLVTSLAEIYLPRRSAEITDATMALIIGLIFALLMDRSAQSAGTREQTGLSARRRGDFGTKP